MVQRCNRPRLALKSLGVFGFQVLDRDDAIEPCVARFPYLARAACADGCEDFIRTQVVAKLERHLFARAKFTRSDRTWVLSHGASGNNPPGRTGEPAVEVIPARAGDSSRCVGSGSVWRCITALRNHCSL